MLTVAGAALLLMPVLVSAESGGAGGAIFDLDGPALYLHVIRGKQSLDIGQVPNLLDGDKLWIQPAFPETQSAHYLLIVSFLRGATNPPPEQWFYRAETWTDEVRSKGLTLSIPDGALQALLLLAPVTGGDFSSLRAAVRRKPGAFVRAVQDLQQANLQRSRLDQYLSAVQKISTTSPAALQKEAPLLAKSLKIKLDEECFQRPPDQQATCLTQNSGNLVLDDGETQSMVAELTTGASSDLIGQISNTRMAGGGAYSPYVGAVVDMVKIFGSMHTARYQYIPAISIYEGERMGLKLNNPPSFHDPKSVMVIGLPRIGPGHAPLMLASESDRVHCLQDSAFALPVEGDPLLFSTSYARDLKLQTKDTAGNDVELPVKSDATHGGLVLSDPKEIPTSLDSKATLTGLWGFDHFDGPTFHVLSASTRATWRLPPEDEGKLLAGRSNTVHLVSEQAGCSEKITLAADSAKPLTWKPEKAEEIEVQLPLGNVRPGEVALEIKQFGIPQAETVKLRAYSGEIKLEGFRYHAGDKTLSVTGAHLEQLASLELDGVRFVPGEDGVHANEATLVAQGDIAALKPATGQTAQITLRDGRILALVGEIQGPRPHVSLIGKEVVAAPANEAPVFVRLGDGDNLPINRTLAFFVKDDAKFNRAMKLEVATVDETASVELSFADGSMILQDAKTARVELNPSKVFGLSVFGEIRFRAIDARGGKSDWQPLTWVVRLPKVTQIVCPEDVTKPCRLEGSDLFLISSLSADQKFTSPVVVPEGFAGSDLAVPRPNGALLYLKLRDAPNAVNRLLAPVFPER